MKIAVFASGGGSDLQAIIDGCKSGALKAEIAVVISNNSNSMALERARNHDIPAFHYSTKTNPEDLDDAILTVLLAHQVDMIFLAGYLRKTGSAILQQFKNRVFNIHPSLLPKFGGQGMFGINVHAAVIEAGESETGITIHRVDDEYDTGAILAQRTVPVMPDDTAEILAARVLTEEHKFIVEIIAQIIDGQIELGVK